MEQAIAGIAGLKPRAPKPEGNGKPLRGELHALDREYRIRRNEALELKNRREIILLAKARGELILRDLVEKQAAFLLVATRQKMLDVPRAYAGRLVGLTDAHEAGEILRGAMIECLDELKDLPVRRGRPPAQPHRRRRSQCTKGRAIPSAAQPEARDHLA